MDAKELGWAIVFVIAGIGLAGWMGHGLYQERMAISTAEPVEATVVSASVEVVPSAHTGGIEGYEADVVYRYTDEGETYTSDVVFPGHDGSVALEKEHARRLVERYEEGSTVTVQVSSRDPSLSYLVEDTRGDTGQFFFLGIGLLMAILPINGLRR